MPPKQTDKSAQEEREACVSVGGPSSCARRGSRRVSGRQSSSLDDAHRRVRGLVLDVLADRHLLDIPGVEVPAIISNVVRACVRAAAGWWGGGVGVR